MTIGADTPLWLAARALLHLRLKEFFHCWQQVLEGGEAEPIHDLRVASRRLREGLALFAPCYPASPLARVIRRVKGVTRLLGEMRNADEALLYFGCLVERLGVPEAASLDTLITGLRKERDQGARHLTLALESLSIRVVRDNFRKTLGTPRLFSLPSEAVNPFSSIGSFARQAIEERLSLVLDLVPEARDEAGIAVQHKLRIAIKHFRYRLEILSFPVTRGSQENIDVLKCYQDLLGRMHDRDVFAGLVRKAGFLPSAERIVLESIARERRELHGEFLVLLKDKPLNGIGERVRSAL
ncbi:CHAD domain-containing protein [Geomobilimonas luticola]|uniref:CHAD domain-containing protein n=1 Tax=Geomobilimonas luticola TaxID=1114878 RepID=A0ABS5SEN3_9BACT|nr:CHAD domain-containing protein [Geomobilimonas luticola]MBT0653645.1 CHAD domain-containing protein [Geomobilimonas luticola]